MKILQIVHSFPPYDVGGAEIYAYNLCQELAKRHDVSVFHRINDLNMQEYALNHNMLDNLEIFAINNNFRLYDSFEMTYKNNAIAQKFNLVLDRVKPDIVHIQHLLFLGGKIIEEIEKRRIPIIFTLHDYWLVCPQGQLFKNNNDVCNGINFGCIDCISNQLNIKENIFALYYFFKKIIPESALQAIKKIYLNYSNSHLLNKEKAINLIKERNDYMKGIFSKIDLFIAPSGFLRKKIIEFGVPENKITLSSYGFNLNMFKNMKKTASNKLRFGFIGTIKNVKGVHILIQAFNKIKNNNIELKIYGHAAPYKIPIWNYLKYIKKIARNKNIKFMGRFDNEKVAKIFEEIDVLVAPSIWYENAPLVIQEAFAAKTPVIASNIGGIPELIKDGINGFLFNYNDIEDLYRKMNLIIENPDLIEDLKQNMRPPRNIEEDTEYMESVYKDLLNKNSLNCSVAYV